MFVVYTNAAQTLIRNEEHALGGPNPFQGSHGQSRVVDPNGIILAEAPMFGDVLLVQRLDMRLAPSIGWGNDTLHHPLFASWWKRGLDTLRPMPLALSDSHKPAVSMHARDGAISGVPSVVDDDVPNTQPTTLRVATAQAITGANVTANVQRMQEFVRQAARHLRDRPDVRRAELVHRKDDADQHHEAARHRVQEELDRRIDAVGSAPDADEEVERHQADFPEHVEQDHVRRQEHPEHAGLHDQHPHEELLDAGMNVPVRREHRDRHHHGGQRDHQHADAVEAESVLDGDVRARQREPRGGANGHAR